MATSVRITMYLTPVLVPFWVSYFNLSWAKWTPRQQKSALTLPPPSLFLSSSGNGTTFASSSKKKKIWHCSGNSMDMWGIHVWRLPRPFRAISLVRKWNVSKKTAKKRLKSAKWQDLFLFFNFLAKLKIGNEWI